MKNPILLITLLIVVINSTPAQEPYIELSFTANYYGEYIPLDSILIENLTQGGDTMLLTPDTVLVLDLMTGTGNPEFINNQLAVSQNIPNPFSNETKIKIYVPGKQRIKIFITDISGRETCTVNRVLRAGIHYLHFTAGNGNIYFLKVVGQNSSETIKMIASDNSKYIYPQLNFEKSIDYIPIFKAGKMLNGYAFSLGDSLRFTGYAKTPQIVTGSFVKDHIPLENTTYNLEIVEGIPCPEIKLVFYKNLFYQTVQLGGQCWLKENLNLGSMISSNLNQTNNGIIEKYCYDDDSTFCEEYGGLYQWDEMMNFTAMPGVTGICPYGWHIPTDEEWCTLTLFIDPTVDCSANSWSGTDCGYKMKTTDGWMTGGEGSNIHGFSGKPGGFYTSEQFIYKKFWGFWWTSSELSDTHSRVRSLQKNENGVSRGGSPKEAGESVRCIKN